MLVADNAMILSLAQGADAIHPFKLFSRLLVFDRHTSRGTPLFTVQTGVYPAFINKNTVFLGYSFKLLHKIRALLFGLF